MSSKFLQLNGKTIQPYGCEKNRNITKAPVRGRILVRQASDNEGNTKKGFGETPTVVKDPSRKVQLRNKKTELNAAQRAMLEKTEFYNQQIRDKRLGKLKKRKKKEPRADVPQVVADRMLRRIAIFCGGPVASGIVVFPILSYLQAVQKLDLPSYVSYGAQLMTFGLGFIGISYGVLSTSWEPAREGSFLGWREFQGNLPILVNRYILKNDKF